MVIVWEVFKLSFDCHHIHWTYAARRVRDYVFRLPSARGFDKFSPFSRHAFVAESRGRIAGDQELLQLGGQVD